MHIRWVAVPKGFLHLAINRMNRESQIPYTYATDHDHPNPLRDPKGRVTSVTRL